MWIEYCVTFDLLLLGGGGGKNYAWNKLKLKLTTWFSLQVTDVALVLISRDFNPEKYETLCQIFLRQYRQTGNPTTVLEGYLSVVTHGTCANDENGKFTSGDYDKKQAYAKVCLKGKNNV